APAAPTLPHGHAVALPSPEQKVKAGSGASLGHAQRASAASSESNAAVKKPPTNKSSSSPPPRSVDANAETRPFVPLPSAAQVVPSQTATFVAGAPPAAVKMP